MSPQRRLLVDLGSLGAANAFGKLLWALSLMLMMRALGPDRYGQLVVVWSFAGLVAPLTDLGLSHFLLREGAREEARAPQLLRLGLSLRVLLGAVVVLIVLAMSRVPGAPGDGMPLLVLALAAAAPLIDATFLTATASAQINGRIALLAAWRLAGILLLAISLLLLLPRLDALATSAAMYAGASLVALCGYFVCEGNGNRASPLTGRATAPIGHTLRQARPFLFMGVAAIAYGKVEVAALGVVADEQSAGFYHAAYQVVLLAFSIPEVLFTATFATLYRTGASPEQLRHRWRPIRRALCAMVAIVGPPMFLYAQDILVAIGGAPFAHAGAVLRYLVPMIALLPAAAAFNFLLLLDRPHERALIDTGCILGTAAVVLLLAPSFGVAAAAAGASLVYAAACAVALHRVSVAGVRLDWLADLLRALLVASPSLLLWLPPWPHWTIAAALQAAVAAGLLYLSGYVRLSDLRTLAA